MSDVAIYPHPPIGPLARPRYCAALVRRVIVQQPSGASRRIKRRLAKRPIYPHTPIGRLARPRY